jgi:CelD/BcsL family acetyltransferase involved in cellulose biosynthesis
MKFDVNPACAVQGPTGSAIPRKLISSFEMPTARDWGSLRQQLPPEWRFLASGWAAAWAESYLPYDRWRLPLRYLTVRAEDGTLTGVLPLVVLQFGPLKFDAAAGYFWPYRSLPLAGRKEVMEATCASMVDALANQPQSRLGLRIGPTSTEDPMCDALVAALRVRGWNVGTRVFANVFVVELPETTSEFDKMCANTVRRVNDYERHLRKLGNLKIIHYSGSDHCDWEKIVGEVAAIERNSWVAREGGTMAFSTTAARDFWIRVLADKFLSSCVTVWLMYIDEHPAAFSCGLDVGNTKYTLANLYDESFKTFRCGNILTRHVLAGAIQRGQKFFDWGWGDSGYKQRWHARPAHALRDILALPPRTVSRIITTVLGRCAGYVFS